MSEGVGVPYHLVLYKYNDDIFGVLDQVDLCKHNTTSSRVLHHLDFYKYNSHILGVLCTSPVFIQIQYQHSRSTSSPGFIRRRPAIMFPSRVNKSLSPATRQRMQCLRFSTIIIRVMTTVKTIFPGFVSFPQFLAVKLSCHTATLFEKTAPHRHTLNRRTRVPPP